MRSAKLAVGGILVSLAAYLISMTADGLLGASAFMLSFAIGTIAIGLAIGFAVGDGQGEMPVFSNPLLISRPSGTCACGRVRLEISGVFVCPDCDVVNSSHRPD